MNKQKIILIIGIILALAAVIMTKAYIDQERQAIQEQVKEDMASKIESNQVPVLVAKRDIARGATVDTTMVETTPVPNNYIQPQAVTSLERLADMVSIAPIAKGEQITLSKFAYPRQTGGLADVTPVGKRAITIPVDNISSLVGMLKPGDYVDVIAMLPVPTQGADGKQAMQLVTLPLFQNVLVLAVGQDTNTLSRPDSRYKKEGGGADISPLITLALVPQETNLIAFVQEQGKIRLVLRSQADSKIEQVQPASWDTLFQYLNLMPKPQEQASSQAEEARLPTKEEPLPVGYVEIFRGLNKEKVPIYK